MSGSNSLQQQQHSPSTRRTIHWSTLVTLVAAVTLLSATTFAGAQPVSVAASVECVTSLPQKEDPSSTSTATGLIGCVSDDASSSSSSVDSLPSPLSSSLPIPSHSSVLYNNNNNKDITLLFPCPSCTDNRPASPLPSTGPGHHHRRPSSLAPLRFSTNRLHPLPLRLNTLPSCTDTTVTNNNVNCDTSSNDSKNSETPSSTTTPSSPTATTTMSAVPSTSSPSSRPLSPAPPQPFLQQQPLFPEPIVFQYVLYYPGNLPLVITAGHGGSAKPGDVLTRKRTHRFRRIPDLAIADPIEISSFAEPLNPSSSTYSPSQSDPATAMIAGLNNSVDEIMPSMALRDQTKGGNFKKDLNTHSIALNLANAISCLTSGVGGGASSGSGCAIAATPDGTSTGSGLSSSRTRARNGNGYGEAGSNDAARMIATKASTTDHGTNAIPARCEQQGPWGDDDSDYPFPTWTSRTSTPTPAPTPFLAVQPQQQQQQPQDQTRRLYQKQAQNYPHVIVFRIPRQFVDVNRNITGENAIAEGDANAEAAWREYHDLIDHVQKMALRKATISINHHRQQEQQEQERKNPPRQQQSSHWTPPQTVAPGRGLLLDIHGHAHATNLIEIGYLLNGTVLNMDDDRLNAYGARLTKETSIRSLINKVAFPSTATTSPPADSSVLLQQGVPFSKLVRGGRTESLGGMLQVQGLNAVPSPDFQAPCQECVFFFGGYTIQRHGSRDHHKVSDLANNDTMDAIQLELPKILRLVDKEQGREVGMKLGRAVVEFAAQYYGLFREHLAVVAREQPDAVVMAAMAKGALSSRSGSSTPRKSGATGSGRGGGRMGATGSNGNVVGGMAGQMLHSTRLQERLARVHHSHNRVPQQQHLHNHQSQAQQQQHQLGTDPSGSVASSSLNNPSDGWDQQSGDSNQSGDSEMENDRDIRRPEIKRQASRL